VAADCTIGVRCGLSFARLGVLGGGWLGRRVRMFWTEK
jgi:hypothetical protein